MRLLVLGGTWFVGRVLAAQAVDRGHDVTVFHRGGPPFGPIGSSTIAGDRESAADLARLADAGPWDAVIDVPGVIPAVVRDSARALAPVASQYVFVSTVSAYQDWPSAPVHESSPLHDADPDLRPESWEWGTGVYGTLKAGAEAAVAREFGDRALIVRPSVILGPLDYSGRVQWWLERMVRGGQVLAPGSPDRSIQPIDVRDLAGFVLDQVEHWGVGTYNLAAPMNASTFGGFLNGCRAATRSTAELVWVEDGWLAGQGVRQWSELPLWRTKPGTWAVSSAKAIQAGLKCRELEATVTDMWSWLESGGRPREHGRRSVHGISAEKEGGLLRAWNKHQA